MGPIGSRAPTVVQEILRHELARRVEKNPQYSLRSYAKHLGMSHTLLSLILNGHRRPSRRVAEKLAEKLCFSPEKTATLLEAIGASRKKGRRSQRSLQSAILSYREIPMDEFALISEWQHYAILSLLEIEDTEFTPKAIAKRLGISFHLAKMSMDRLHALNLLERNETTGKWRQRGAPFLVDNKHSTVWTRKFQRQLLEKAIDSLESDPKEIRDLSSTTFAMHPKHVPYALKRIREFRHQLTQELEQFGDPQEVYNLTVQIFPVSKRSRS